MTDSTAGDAATAATRGRRLPFVIIPSWVLMAPVSDRAVRIYGLLAHHADRHTREAYPSRARLAALAGCSVDSVDRSLRDLVAAGAVDVLRRHDASGRSLSSIYVVHEAPPTPLGEGRTAAAPEPQGCTREGRTAAARTRTTGTRNRARERDQDPTRPTVVKYDPDEAEARFADLTGEPIRGEHP